MTELPTDSVHRTCRQTIHSLIVSRISLSSPHAYDTTRTPSSPEDHLCLVHVWYTSDTIVHSFNAKHSGFTSTQYDTTRGREPEKSPPPTNEEHQTISWKQIPPVLPPTSCLVSPQNLPLTLWEDSDFVRSGMSKKFAYPHLRITPMTDNHFIQVVMSNTFSWHQQWTIIRPYMKRIDGKKQDRQWGGQVFCFWLRNTIQTELKSLHTSGKEYVKKLSTLIYF